MSNPIETGTESQIRAFALPKESPTASTTGLVDSHGVTGVTGLRGHDINCFISFSCHLVSIVGNSTICFLSPHSKQSTLPGSARSVA